LEAGILEVPGGSMIPDLSPVTFDADIKDAGLSPVRDRMIKTIRTLREIGHAREATAVGSALRALSGFASLPIGLAEARSIATILFDGDGREEIAIRSSFFSSSALQPMANIDATAPGVGADVRTLLEEIRSRVSRWESDTPVSLKLSQVLVDPQWNSREVLLVLPDGRTADVFLVSNRGIGCACTVIGLSDLAQQAGLGIWSRIILVRPEPKAIRVLLTMPNASSRILLIGDTVGASIIMVELSLLGGLPEFKPFAVRTAALSAALIKGGACETMDLAELQPNYSIPAVEEIIDFTQDADGYVGEVIRFQFEEGGQADYRPGGEVLVFTPDAVRSFVRTTAREVQVGDGVLVLRKDIRDKLSEVLSRSKKIVAELKQYHKRVVSFREALPGDKLTIKAKHVLDEMRLINPVLADSEVHNITRWLSVEVSDTLQQPRAARDWARFSLFMEVAGIEREHARMLWSFAVLPSRSYSAQEGHLFNRRIVQFMLDPEGIAAGEGWSDYEGLWQAVMDSVDHVIHKENLNG
jgi:hypothetical protein